MIKLLLDEHISPDVADGVKRLLPSLIIVALKDWEQGSFMGQPDPVLLGHAAKLGCTLVTYDLRTIAPLLKEWAEQGTSHGGVLFLHSRTLPSSDLGGMVRAIVSFATSPSAKGDWRNRVHFLQPEP